MLATPPSGHLSGHGLTVPTGREFAYTPRGDGLVVATVTWDKPAGKMTARGYATELEQFERIAALDNPDLGSWVFGLRSAGQLPEFQNVATRFRAVYRVDDLRKGFQGSYLVQIGMPATGDRLWERIVYRYFDSEADPKDPGPTSFEYVVGLISSRDKIFIEDTTGLPAGTTFDDPAAEARWVLPGHVVVWDLAAIYCEGS